MTNSKKQARLYTQKEISEFSNEELLTAIVFFKKQGGFEVYKNNNIDGKGIESTLFQPFDTKYTPLQTEEFSLIEYYRKVAQEGQYDFYFFFRDLLNDELTKEIENIIIENDKRIESFLEKERLDLSQKYNIPLGFFEMSIWDLGIKTELKIYSVFDFLFAFDQIKTEGYKGYIKSRFVYDGIIGEGKTYQTGENQEFKKAIMEDLMDKIYNQLLVEVSFYSKYDKKIVNEYTNSNEYKVSRSYEHLQN